MGIPRYVHYIILELLVDTGRQRHEENTFLVGSISHPVLHLVKISTASSCWRLGVLVVPILDVEMNGQFIRSYPMQAVRKWR